jgi:hypothetical protein
MYIIETLIDSLMADPKLRTATKILSPKSVIRVSRRLKPSKRNTRNEFVVTIGVPNYTTLKFIRLCTKVKEPFPILKIQFENYPKKKKKTTAVKDPK